MISSVVILLLLQVASVSATQQTDPRPTDKQIEKCVIAGAVVKAISGEPLKKAVLNLRNADSDDPEKAVTTDGNGRFEIKDVEPGRHHLEASSNGYVTLEFGQHSPERSGTILTLRPGEHLLDISFRLIPAAAISGHVYDEDGDPVAGAQVQALRFRYEDGTRRLMVAQDTQTNDLGEYRIFGLNPGRYYMAVFLDRGQFGFLQEGDAPRYYPGAADPSGASSLALHAGDDLTGTDFNLVPVQTFLVKGNVYDAVNSRPGVHAVVWLMARGSETQTYFSSKNAVPDAQGAFVLHGVRPGSYSIFAWNADSESKYIARETIDITDANLEGVRLVIGPGIDLKGRIFVEGNAALDVNVLTLGLRGREGSASIDPSVASIKPNGNFVIRNIAEGTYQLQVEGLPANFYVKTAWLAGQDALRSDLNVSRNQPLGSLDVVLNGNGGHIEGRVLKGEKPFSGARVVLVPEEGRQNREQLYKCVSTDQNGQFVIHGIAPGIYTLFAWENVEEGAYQDPEFLRTYKTDGKPVLVKEGSHLSHQLELISTNEPAGSE